MTLNQAFSRRTRGAALLALLLGCTSFGKQPTDAHPAKKASELYLSFFFFHESFVKWTEDRVASNPDQRGRIVLSSSKFLGISPDEFDALTAITKQVTSKLRAVGDEARQYVSSAAASKDGVDRKTLADFNARRLGIIQDGVATIAQTLSTQSWQGL